MASDPKGITPTKGWSSPHYRVKGRPTKSCFQNACLQNLRERVEVINVRPERHTDASTLQLLTEDSHLANPTKIFDKETVEHNSMKEMMIETTTLTLKGPYLKEIHEFTLLLVKHPIITDRVEVEMLEQCVCIKGPFELVKEVYDGLPKCLTRAISNGDWPSLDELSRIASDVIETTDDELPPNLTTGIGGSSGTSLHSMDGLDPLFITLMEKNNLLEGINLKFSQDRTQVFAADENDHESIKVFSDLYSESKSSHVNEDFLLPRTTNCSWLVNHLQFKFPSVVFCPRQDGSLLGLSLNKPVLLSVRDFLNSPKLLHPIVSSSHGEPCVVVQLSHKLTVTIKKGNLVKQEVSAIVNAANEQLRHGAGVALAIDKASQWRVQKASEKALKQLRPPKVPTGQALITSAGGNLKCRAVIHAVGPDAAVFKPEQCRTLLHQACVQSLGLAEEHKMTSVAFPPISSGIFGMDKTVVAQVMIDTICQYKYEPTSTLVDVRIVIIDNETLQPFLDYGAHVASIQAFVPTSNSSHSPQQPSVHDISPRQNRPVIGDQMVRDSHQVLVPLAKSHRKLIVKTGNIIYANAEIKIVAISSPAEFKVGHSASLDLALDGLLQQTVNRRYQNGMPDKYDVFTVHCSPNSKVNCRFLVVANILDRDLGRRSDAPKFLQQILHSVCKEADTLEMPTAAVTPATFDCGGFPKDSILPAFIKMMNEYNFTNDEFLTKVTVLAVSDDDFSVLVQSAERAVGQPLPRFKDHDTPRAPVSTPGSAHLPQQPSAGSTSPQAAQIKSSFHHQTEPVIGDQMSHKSHQVPVPLTKSHRKLVVSKGNILYGNADIKIVAIFSPEGFNVGQNASLNSALGGLLQQTVDRRYQSSRPDKYDVFTVHCSPNFKVNCRFLVVANIVDRDLGRRSDAPKYLQQILHSVCREADTLEMPTAAIAPGSFDCGGFPMDSILPAFIKMLNEYNFTNDEFLTEVNVFAMSDDDFSVLVQSAERAVGQPLLQPRNHPPRPPSKPTEGNPATGSSIVGNVVNAISSWLTGSSPDKVQNEPPPQHTHNILSTPVKLYASQPAHCSSITMGSKCTLSVKLGNIFEEAVDAIVNPTNGNLDLISGISSALNEASRGAVKRECTALVSRRGGPVPSGSVAVTESGRHLKSKWIIHVNVYDTEESSIQDCSQLLLQSLANVLKVAENNHLSSVALTLFFPRTYGLELASKMIAHYFINAIVHSSFSEQSSLKELRLLVDDEQSFVTFQKELQTVSSMITATLPHPDSQSHASQVQPSRTEPNSRNVVQSGSTEPDVFEIPTQSSRRRLVVKKSRFLNEVADIKIVAICSEDQKHPSAKSLDKMLNGALVQSITRRYQDRKPSQFDVFTVHCPPEATLQCRFLVVVNMLDRKLGQGVDSHKHLNQILHNVCREADTLEMPTVAIASGTLDIGGFPRESILPAFVRMISQYNFTNNDFLTDVKFLTANDDAFASMCADVKHSFGTPAEGKLDARSPPSPAGSPYTHGAHCSPNSYHGRDVPNVQVVVGDIVAFLADAVVVPVSSALDLKGIVSEAVNKATHGQLRVKVNNLKIKDGDIVPYKRSMFVTSQWNIKAHHLYLLCRSKNSQIDTLKKGLASALDEATFHNLKSIAFPIPFLSKKGSKATTADFAKALNDAVTLHQATNPAIVVTVVVSKDEPPAVLKCLQESFRNPVTTSSDSIDTEV